MNAREAIAHAKRLFQETFADEPIVEVGLEEIEINDGEVWQVTIGFAREAFPLNRWYKVVTFWDTDGSLISIKNRSLVSS